MAITPTVVDDLTHRLRDEILHGSLLPGERIRIRNVEERFGVSHIPIREALRRLESEGLVHSKPRHGSVVSSLSISELRDIYSLRLAIEPSFSRKAVELAPEGWATELAECLERWTSAGDLSRAAQLEAHQTFHFILLQPSLSVASERIVTQLWRLAERYVAYQFRQAPSPEPVLTEHVSLVEAAAAGDGDLLAQRLSLHLQHTITELEPLLVTIGMSA